jgi:hypothetical protein
MPIVRRRRGFERAGSCAPNKLGFSSARAREVKLALAWRRVAGGVLADRTPGLRVKRGVLEVEAPDRRWNETLIALLPRLAGKLAADHPELGVRKCRVITHEATEDRAGGRRTPPPTLELVTPNTCTPTGAPEVTGESDGRTPRRPADADPVERLRVLGERYLARGEMRRDQKP